MMLRKINSDAATKLDMDIARDGFLPNMPITGFSHGYQGQKPRLTAIGLLRRLSLIIDFHATITVTAI